MFTETLYQTYQRHRTLQTSRITALPIVILMPHSACNCRCVMCDIWKGNHNLRQLNEQDIQRLLASLKKFGTRQVLMSGGEALLNPNFFRFCEILNKEKIKVSLLSTGLTLKKNATLLVGYVNDIIVSLDGDKETHDRIRNIPGAFQKMKEGFEAIKRLNPDFKISARTVIHQLNFRKWPAIIEAAKEIGLQQISFLPADVSSHAFNRELTWDEKRQHEILLSKDDLPDLEKIIEKLLITNSIDFENNFIAESPEKIKKIYSYYAAFYGLNEFPFKRCNAPWVSTVIEADGNVRPCFFHPSYGNIRQQSLDKILNSDKAIGFRKNLDMDKNEVCKKCVCYLNLAPRTRL
ncbi:radical SAM protein [Hanamia caeni]|uniref:Radical SAM protein n=1 Tax=Hanamia caeni TaxID=2294116 RepID=A0A3M9NM79_9BACT|nr:radical SAM protein [Hanamia caeni]RNI38764.1 radical SAM protein [Hanamia caeni]